MVGKVNTATTLKVKIVAIAYGDVGFGCCDHGVGGGDGGSSTYSCADTDQRTKVTVDHKPATDERCAEEGNEERAEQYGK